MIDDELAARARTRIGTTLRGKYRIDGVLGIGGMAVVYAGTHRNGRAVALKLLHPELSLRSDIRTRFLREGHAANAVKHPGAVAVLDDDVAEDGAAFLVMELLEGASIEAVWEKHGRRLPLRAVLAVGDQVLDVLAAAHAAGIVHRDLKPANLFLTRDGAIKVLDFGIARLRDVAASQATQTGMMLGTPAYMAPEQALGRAAEIDAQTDLWAVGATLFTLASGCVVHEGDTPQALLVRAATAPARPLARLIDAPAPIARVIDRALAFDKSARWLNAAEMREALRSASAGAFGAETSATSLRELIEASPDLALLPTQASDAPAPKPTGPVASAPQAQAQTPATVQTMDRPLASLVGGTTAQPVSSGPAARNPLRVEVPRVERRGSARMVAALAALLLVVLGGALFASRASRQTTTEPTTASVSATTPASTASATAPPVVNPVPEIAVTDLPQAKPAPAPKPSATIVHSAGAPAATQPTKASCIPPYEVDAQGLKHWKKECL